MTTSLDGFMNDREGSAESLNPDFAELLESTSFKEMTEQTGAIIMGRRVYEMADPFRWINYDYEFQVPIFVVTHVAPGRFPQGNDNLTLTFVTDGVASAVAQAKDAAGDKLVQIIGGADVIQQCLNAGLCDELEIDIIPIVLGKGLRLLENIDADAIKLERSAVVQTTLMRTSITFKVTKRSPSA